MDIKELYDFSKWFLNYGQEVQKLYRTLLQKLEHNATQPQKQPVRDDLNALLETLKAMPLHMLSNEQIDLLEQDGVRDFIGKAGARNIERIVKSARFDPASATTDVQEITEALNITLAKTRKVQEALSEIDGMEDEASTFDYITIRIHFKESANISDIGEWKEWADEWYEIIRGVAMSVDEAPENVKILGAHQGSIILVLGATATVTGLLLLISNHLTKIALNGLQIANGVADFKQKLRLNKTIAEGLEKAIATAEKDQMKELLDTAVASLPNDIDGEQANALNRSIAKYKAFMDKGGEVEFLAPPEPDEEDYEEFGEEAIEKITGVREDIEQLRNTREETRLITNQMDEEEDFEDEDLEDDPEP